LTTFDDKFISVGYGGSYRANYWLYDGTNFHGKFLDSVARNDACAKRLGETPFVGYVQYTRYDGIAVALFAPCFFSINNLAAPVIKTNNDTMKVTYRITW
jgi:hypothetical protein